MSPVVRPQEVKQTIKKKTYKIKFDNGVVVDFDRQPTTADIEEIAIQVKDMKKPLS